MRLFFFSSVKVLIWRFGGVILLYGVSVCCMMIGSVCSFGLWGWSFFFWKGI